MDNLTERDLELIEEYLSDQSGSDDKKVTIEKEVSSFDEKLLRIRQLKSIIRHYGLRDEISSIRAKMKEDKNVVPYHKPEKPSFRLFFRIAASFLILLTVSLGIVYNATDNNEMYEWKYEPYQFPTIRGASSQFSELKGLYQLENYAEATQLFNSIDSPSPNELMIGLAAHMEAKEYTKAVKICDIILNNNQRFVDDAEYYKAMALLKLNQVEESRLIFNSIAEDPAHSYNQVVDRWFLFNLNLLSIK